MNIIIWFITIYSFVTLSLVAFVLLRVLRSNERMAWNLAKLEIEKSVLSSGLSQKHDVGYLYKALKDREQSKEGQCLIPNRKSESGEKSIPPSGEQVDKQVRQEPDIRMVHGGS